MNETTTESTKTVPKHTPSLPDKIERIKAAWSSLASANVYGGMTPAQFSAAVAPYLEGEAVVSALKLSATATVVEKRLADKESRRQLNAVVSGIKANPAFGPDSGLYRACGYIPNSERMAPQRGTPNPTGLPEAPATKAARPGMYERLALVVAAWETIGAETKFAELTSAEFKTATAESHATRARLATLNAHRNAAISARNAARVEARRAIQKVMAGVVITDGKTSPIYHAMGYKNVG